MNPIKKKATTNPSPLDMKVHKTERTAVAILTHWMREIINNKLLDLGMPDVETLADDRLMPDAVIYESQRSQNVLCVIEAKPPSYDVFDERALKEPARKKASYRKAKYFAVTNFKFLIWFSTEKVNALKPEEEQIVEKYLLSDIENLDDIEQTRYSNAFKKGLEEFLIRLYSVHSGKEPEPKLAIDDFLVFRLHQKIDVLANYYGKMIHDQCHKDTTFARQLMNWFLDQQWSFTWQPGDFMKAARQAAYLLVNKILFYDLLQAKRPKDLDPLEIPETRTKGHLLQKNLENYFNDVLKIDYESIFTSDFIDSIAFPNVYEIVEEIKSLINILKRYDFSKMGYDIIGRIFEQLIPMGERHSLGQYFTNPDIVDLILKFCLNHEDDRIVDPSCGAGTFLVRAYQHKKLMNERLSHEQILETLWGNDIAKFPAHLAAINLAINDLGVDKNYPNILQSDFFELQVGDQGFDLSEWRKKRAATLGLKEREITYPRWFNAVVGNPPYTRQEEISEISPDDAAYKESLIENSLYFHGKKIATISKRAGIHAYFFVHGTKFLAEGGYFGFIVSNSWLDVDYGKGLQEFFLKNYKIIAIIESKVERWFEQADINTCIVILQKCSSNQERDDHLARFVYLKRPLRDFIPPAQDLWEKQLDRLNQIDKLKRTILAHNDFYENKELRILSKCQRDLWEEGYDLEREEYVGAKWGKYLRAPEIFHKCINSERVIQIKNCKNIRVKRGLRPGDTAYFYLSDNEIQKHNLESEYTSPILRSPQNLPKKIFINDDYLSFRVLDVQISKDQLKDKAKNIFKYIERGEKKEINKKNIHSINYWYSLPTSEYKSKIIIPEAFNIVFLTHYCPSNPVVDQRFNILKIEKAEFEKALIGYMNSSFFFLMVEIFGRTNLGEGALDFPSTDLNQTYIFNFDVLSKSILKKIDKISDQIIDRPIGSIFEEIGANNLNDVKLDKVKPDRRELDKIIMGEILGLTDEEQLEIYQSIIDLVRSRIQKAQTFNTKNKTKVQYQIEDVKNNIVTKIRDGI